AARGRQRIHHEAVRQRNRRGQVPGGRADLTAARPSGVLTPSRGAVLSPSRVLMTITAAPRPVLHSATAQRPIRVMVVDDAVVVRGLIVRWVESEPGVEVVAALRSGREAIAQIAHAEPDVVILDVDMPDMDGITALPRLLAAKPDLVVIMASTLTRRNAEISLRALSLGAADYIPKPETTREVTTSESFRRDLVAKIRALVSRRHRP